MALCTVGKVENQALFARFDHGWLQDHTSEASAIVRVKLCGWPSKLRVAYLLACWLAGLLACWLA